MPWLWHQTARHARRGGRVLLYLALGVGIAAAGEPYSPPSDDTVLARLPAADAIAKLAPLQAAVSAQPQALRPALRLARAYIELARDKADPRFLGYAEATLAPWPEDAPPQLLVLRATIAQSRHHFDQALALLNRALAAEPGNAQALLTRAIIHQVQGRLTAAAEDCQRLNRRTSALVTTICRTGVASLRGRLEPAYQRLRKALAAAPEAPPNIRVWGLTLLGEMAVRLGKPEAAEAHFRGALTLDPGDVYLLAAYADLLLARGDNEAVLELLRGHESQDVLLLRLALAGDDSAAGRRWQRMLEARFEAAARRGLNTHRREHARFLLAQGDIQRALKLARANWQVQHEPADIRILLRAARAAGRPEAAQPALEWMREHGYQDARIAELRDHLTSAVAQ